MTKVFLIVSVACNVWFLLMLLSDRITETKFVRFLKGAAGLWRSLGTKSEKQDTLHSEAPDEDADIIGKSRFRMAPTRTTAAISTQEAAISEKGIELSEEDATFDDENTESASRTAQVPEEKFDETFTSIPPEELKFGDDEPEDEKPDKGQASGVSFDEIGEAVGIARKDNPTDEEKRQAGKVFSDLEGTELLAKLHKMKVKISGCIDFYLYDEPTVKVEKVAVKKELVIPKSFEEFNIRDFMQ